MEKEEMQRRIEESIELALYYGTKDGSHHKMYGIDQILRTLGGDRYKELVRELLAETNGEWDEGIDA